MFPTNDNHLKYNVIIRTLHKNNKYKSKQQRSHGENGGFESSHFSPGPLLYGNDTKGTASVSMGQKVLKSTHYNLQHFMGNASDRISERSYSASPDLTSKLPHCKITGCASVSGRYSAAYMTQAHDGQWRFTISEVIGYKPRVAA